MSITGSPGGGPVTDVASPYLGFLRGGAACVCVREREREREKERERERERVYERWW